MEARPSIHVDGYGAIQIPEGRASWMLPKEFVGEDINWYMVQSDHIRLIPAGYIDEFYQNPSHRLLFEHLLHVCSSSEYLNLICNSCHYIRSPEHQQWLMTAMNYKNKTAAEFMIDDLRNSPEDQELKKLRTSIWMLIK